MDKCNYCGSKQKDDRTTCSKCGAPRYSHKTNAVIENYSGYSKYDHYVGSGSITPNLNQNSYAPKSKLMYLVGAIIASIINIIICVILRFDFNSTVSWFAFFFIEANLIVIFGVWSADK